MATKNVKFYNNSNEDTGGGGSVTLNVDKGNGAVTADTLRTVSATNDPNLTQIESDLSDIDTKIATSNGHLTNIETSTASTDTKLTTTNSRLSTIATETASSDAHLATIETNTTSSDGKLTTIANEVTSSDTHLANIESTNSSINTNLSNCISSNTLKVTVAAGTPYTSGVYNANVTNVETDVIASIQVDSFSTFFLWIQNTGAVPLTDVAVYASVTGIAGTWVDLDSLQDSGVEASCKTLGAGLPGIAFMAIGPHAFKYIRLRATTGTATTVSAYVTAKY